MAEHAGTGAMTKRWTPYEDDYLRNHCRTMPYAKIAKFLGRPVSGVRNRVYRLGITEKNWWTSDEIGYLRSAYESAGSRRIDLDKISTSLGRRKSDVCKKAKELGLTNQRRMKTDSGPTDRRKFKGDITALREYQSSAMKEKWRKEGHPRGMAGKKHSPETLERLSRISRDRWAAMSEDDRQDLLDKGYAARRANGFSPPKSRRGSWASGWRTVGGKRVYFRSRWEANYARYLEWLVGHGEIAKWAYEPETFWFEQIKRGVRSYKPDFRVWLPDGTTELHEVKGWMDSRSKTTLRRMAKYYPDTVIKLIDRDAYKSIRLAVRNIISDWEDSERDGRL